MNSNKISCQKYVSSNSLFKFIPILEMSAKFASQICHENINKPLDGAYLTDFGINISQRVAQSLSVKLLSIAYRMNPRNIALKSIKFINKYFISFACFYIIRLTKILDLAN